jgi:hypothetical protein
MTTSAFAIYMLFFFAEGERLRDVLPGDIVGWSFLLLGLLNRRRSFICLEA